MVFDSVDVKDVIFHVEGEQHAIVAAPCRAQAKPFICEGLLDGIAARGLVTNSTIAAAVF